MFVRLPMTGKTSAMANTNAPFGFSVCGSINGPVNFSMYDRKISSAYTTAIFYGDAVQPIIGSATGYIGQGTGSTTPLAGVFLGCSYQSVSQKKTVFSNYWPGSDAAGDVTAKICSDPNTLFLAQAGGTSIGFSDIGQNAQLAVGTGSTVTGWSGMYITSVGTTTTYPFIIYDVPSAAVDPVATTAYNWVIVQFNYIVGRAGFPGIS